MLNGRRIGKWILYFLGSLVLLLLLGFAYLAWVSKVDPPVVANKTSLTLERKEPSKGFYTLNNSWFRKSNSGLYELYVEGEPFERGVIN